MSDTTSLNQAFFNKLAPSYDQKYQTTVGQLQRELKQRASSLGAKPGGRLLDYACGTGLVTGALGAHLGQCVGIDISESMVEQYNAKARAEGLAPDKRSAHVGNLVSPTDPSPAAFASPNFFSFDLAGVGLGFHHIDDCDLAARRIAERIRPGGVFFIVDFVSHAPVESHASSRGVRHHGFTEGQVRAIFDGAGVGRNFKFDVMSTDISFEHAHGDGKHMVRRVFFASGEKETPAAQI